MSLYDFDVKLEPEESQTHLSLERVISCSSATDLTQVWIKGNNSKQSLTNPYTNPEHADAKQELNFDPTYGLEDDFDNHTKDPLFIQGSEPITETERPIQEAVSLELRSKFCRTCRRNRNKICQLHFELEQDIQQISIENATTDASDVMTYSCKRCSFSSSNYVDVWHHLNMAHYSAASQDTACDNCHFVSKDPAHLRQHKLLRKSDKRRRNCSYCDKYFCTQNSLTNHKLLHRQENSTNTVQTQDSNGCVVTEKLQEKKSSRKPLVKSNMMEENEYLTHSYRTDSEMLCCDRCEYTCRLKVTLDQHRLFSHFITYC